MCRICLEEVELDVSGDFIAPCRCDGNSKYVHRQCLSQWRATSPRAYRQCLECNFKYLLEYEYPLETFSFNIHNQHDMGRHLSLYCFSLLFTCISGFFFRNIGKRINYPSLWLLNAASRHKLPNPIPYEKELLDKDDIASGCYYFSLTSSSLNLICNIYFFLCISIKIRRIFQYWNLMGIRFVATFIYTFHILWTYMALSWEEGGFATFVLFDTLLSIFNLWTYFNLLKHHNKTIIILNTHNNKSILIEPPRLIEEV